MDINSLPAKVMFLIWLKNALSTKDATVSKKNKRVLNLSYGATKNFLLGRRVNNTPIISLPHDAAAWFFTMNIYGIAHSEDGCIHFLYGKTHAEMCLSLKVNPERSRLISGCKSQIIDLYSHTTSNDGELHISGLINRVRLFGVDEIEDLMPNQKSDIWGYDEHLTQEFDINDPENFKNFSDPL